MKLDEIGAKLTAGRRSGRELSPFARAAIVGAVGAGASQSAVADAFGVSRATVQDTLHRFESSTTFTSKPRSGRPEILTRREKRYIIQLAKRKPRLSI
jgi:transposase